MKKIVVTPYNSEWPALFKEESLKIKEALGDNCLEIHHVGSTSIPGLSAKPVIDILAVVKNPKMTIHSLEALGYEYRGEFNIPMHFGFNRSEGIRTNLHVFEEGNPEIELNLVFRDYLRSHPDAKNEYATLKETLLKDESSHEKPPNSLFTRYNLGKDAFIRKILKAANFNRIRIMRCVHYAEWEAAKRLTTENLDPSAFDPKEHLHLILYQGAEIIGYARIHLCSDRKAVLEIMIIEEGFRHHRGQFTKLCEQWMKTQEMISFVTE